MVRGKPYHPQILPSALAGEGLPPAAPTACSHSGRRLGLRRGGNRGPEPAQPAGGAGRGAGRGAPRLAEVAGFDRRRLLLPARWASRAWTIGKDGQVALSETSRFQEE